MLTQYEGLKEKKEVLEHCGFDYEDLLRKAADCNKDVFYICTIVDTKLISEQAQLNHLAGNGRSLNTFDHFYSRKKSSEQFLKHWVDGRFRFDNIDRVALWIKSRCRVNTITKEENRALISIQNNPDTKYLHHSRQYGLAGIKLEEKLNRVQKWVYIVDGIRYIDSSELCAKYNIKSDTITRRCLNDNFPNWTRIERFEQGGLVDRQAN